MFKLILNTVKSVFAEETHEEREEREERNKRSRAEGNLYIDSGPTFLGQLFILPIVLLITIMACSIPGHIILYMLVTSFEVSTNVTNVLYTNALSPSMLGLRWPGFIFALLIIDILIVLLRPLINMMGISKNFTIEFLKKNSYTKKFILKASEHDSLLPIFYSVIASFVVVLISDVTLVYNLLSQDVAFNWIITFKIILFSIVIFIILHLTILITSAICTFCINWRIQVLTSVLLLLVLHFSGSISEEIYEVFISVWSLISDLFLQTFKVYIDIIKGAKYVS